VRFTANVALHLPRPWGCFVRQSTLWLQLPDPGSFSHFLQPHEPLVAGMEIWITGATVRRLGLVLQEGLCKGWVEGQNYFHVVRRHTRLGSITLKCESAARELSKHASQLVGLTWRPSG
jgi:hypothetical protein